MDSPFMRRLTVVAVITVTAICLPSYGDDAAKTLHERRENAFFTYTGDVLRFAIPASALGYSIIIKDSDGITDWALSVGSAVVLTEGLKYAIGRPRPYQEPNERGLSFPSGHTTMAFAGAAYWQRRYGWQVGVPAYVLAAAAGYSRIWSGNHYWSDVIAGAAIGMALPYIFTKPYERVQINVGAEPDGGGNISITVRF